MDVLLFPLTRMGEAQADEPLSAVPLPSKPEILFYLPQTPASLCTLTNLSL